MSTSIYTAAKTEECQIRVDFVISALRQLVTTKSSPVSRFKQTDILDCEFYICAELKFDLVLFHPYRPLVLYVYDFETGFPKICVQ